MHTLWWRTFYVFSPHIFICQIEKNTSKRNRFSNILNMQFQKVERTLEKKTALCIKTNSTYLRIIKPKEMATSL